MNLRDYPATNFIYRRNRSDGERPTTFELLGRTWDLLPEVFSPMHSPSTAVFTEHLPYPSGGSFLEVGCGTGVTAVTAALRGCRPVTATDIVTSAVENARLNGRRHGVADVVRVLQGDMFDALTPADRFDLIFWNSNFVDPPSGFRNTEDLHHALFDPGYAAHEAFVRSAADHLSPGGRVVLGFANIGNWPRLEELLAAYGWAATPLLVQRPEGPSPVEYHLLELRATTGQSTAVTVRATERAATR